MFYDTFKLLCEERDVSVSRACIEMGLSRSIAAKWKNTKTNPSADVLPKISKYFNIPVDSLLGNGDFAIATSVLEVVGKKIASACNELGETAEESLGKIYIMPADIQRMLHGEYPFTVSSLNQIAAHVQKPMEYFLEGYEKKTPILTNKDERDIQKRLEALLGDLDGEDAGSLMFSGEPLDEETRELLRISLRGQLELSKQLAKKYTPKKYLK